MELIVTLFTFTLAGTIAALTGFGVATVSMGILPFFIPLSLALPVVAMASTFATGLIAARTATPAIIRKVAPLLFGSLLGVTFSMLYLMRLNEHTLRVALSLVLLLIAAAGLMKKRIHLSPRKRYGFVMGFLGGLSSAAFNIHGPLIALYAAARGSDKHEMRGLIAVYMFLTGLSTVAGHALSGRAHFDTLQFFLLAMPLLILGMFIGRRLFRSLSEDAARRFVYGFVSVAAFLMFVHAIT